MLKQKWLEFSRCGHEANAGIELRWREDFIDRDPERERMLDARQRRE
jgi:hypothetical protein